MEEDFQSLSKVSYSSGDHQDEEQANSQGVFVVPFNASSAGTLSHLDDSTSCLQVEAGPSKPHRPLKRVYDDLYSSYENAHHVT